MEIYRIVAKPGQLLTTGVRYKFLLRALFPSIRVSLHKQTSDSSHVCSSCNLCHTVSRSADPHQ